MFEEVRVFSFSGIYEQEVFWQSVSSDALSFYDLTTLQGTNGYLDDSARAKIERILDDNGEQKCARARINFIDSGNTHYMSHLLLARVNEPFVLILFDHHPDLLAPSFGEILSCGGWLLETLRTNRHALRAFLVGVDKALADEAMAHSGGVLTPVRAFDGTDGAGHMGRLFGKEIRLLQGGEILSPLNELCAHLDVAAAPPRPASLESSNKPLPVYISIDKDVLRAEDVTTNWDQGDMHEDELFACLMNIRDKCRLLGVDVCGEPSVASCDVTDIKKNNNFNKKILDFFMKRE